MQKINLLAALAASSLLSILANSITPGVCANDASQIFQSALKLDAAGRHKDASKAYIELLRLQPQNLRAQDSLCLSAEKVVTKAPKDYESYMLLGNAYACRGDFIQAEEAFNKAIKFSKGNTTEALKDIGRLRLLTVNVHSASQWLETEEPKSLVCPFCNSSNDLVPVVSGTPTPEQTHAIESGKAYLAPEQSETSTLPQWYCMNCHKIFASDAPPKTRKNNPDLAPFLADVLRRIKAAWTPPKNEEQLQVVVIFRVDKNGQITNARIETSSKVADVDEAALKSVEKSAPYRSLPEFSEEHYDLKFTFTSRERRGNLSGAFIQP